MTKKKPAVKRLARTPMLPKGVHSGEKVLTFVADILEQEPKRLFMPAWLTTLKGKPVAQFHSGVKRPACGTVACIGGWINVVTRNNEGYQGADALRKLGILPWWDENPERNDLRSELEALFEDIEAPKGRVIGRLRNIIAKYRKTLQQLPVTVE